MWNKLSPQERAQRIEAARQKATRNGVKITTKDRDNGGKIHLMFVPNNAGIGTWGAVDCLAKHAGYVLAK